MLNKEIPTPVGHGPVDVIITALEEVDCDTPIEHGSGARTRQTMTQASFQL
jgi:hypothetical protein